MKKTQQRIIICLLTGIFLLGGCSGKITDSDTVALEYADNSVTYNMAVAGLGTVTSSRQIGCTYRQVNEQKITISLSGRVIDRVNVEQGDIVKKGDLLLELETDDLEERIRDLDYSLSKNQLLLAQSEENKELAIEAREIKYTYHSEQTSADWVQKEKDLEKIRKEYRYKREDYQDAVALDTQELTMLEEELAESRIYSEINGTISSVKSKLEGSISKKDDVVMTVIDGSECLFETEVLNMLIIFRMERQYPCLFHQETAKANIF